MYNLTPQLIVLYYLLLYEDTVLNNIKIIGMYIVVIGEITLVVIGEITLVVIGEIILVDNFVIRFV